jgi:cysteine synthase A
MNILDLIGNTPLQSISNIYFKMEMYNPSGSIKDRTAKEMILQLIGHIDDPSGFTLVEASTGNTGISVSMIATALGCKSVVYVCSGTSQMKIKLMKSYGATVIMCSSIKRAIQKAKAHDENMLSAFYLDQFSNPDNVKGLEKMAEEVYDDMNAHLSKYPSQFDAVVAGVGTGGTIVALHNTFPDADVYMVKPLGSDKIDGIADGVPLPLVPKDMKYDTIYVPGTRARRTARYLKQTYGIDCGVSSGANYYASTLLSKKYKKILTVFPDGGYRYL